MTKTVRLLIAAVGVVFMLNGLANSASEKKEEYQKRDKNNPVVTMVTNHGDMVLELFHDVAPTHVDSFLARVDDGFYSNTLFHRIIKDFMIQGGGPRPGEPPVDYTLNAEFSDLKHEEGTLAAARTPDPNSASTQFYICLTRERTKHLDKQYTIFGHLVSGYDVLHEIGNVKTGPGDKPIENVILREVYRSDLNGKRLEQPKKAPNKEG